MTMAMIMTNTITWHLILLLPFKQDRDEIYLDHVHDHGSPWPTMTMAMIMTKTMTMAMIMTKTMTDHDHVYDYDHDLDNTICQKYDKKSIILILNSIVKVTFKNNLNIVVHNYDHDNIYAIAFYDNDDRGLYHDHDHDQAEL